MDGERSKYQRSGKCIKSCCRKAVRVESVFYLSGGLCNDAVII
jgi:hypothetical protein